MSPEPPNMFDLSKDDNEKNIGEISQDNKVEEGNENQVSAADYDPSLDRQEDEQRRLQAIATKQDHQETEEVEEVEEEEEEDDLDDMFAVDVKPKKVKKTVKVKVKVSHECYLCCRRHLLKNPFT